MKLIDHINKNYGADRGNKAEFARDNKVTPQQVNNWINRGFEVIDGKLVQVKRALVNVNSK